MLRWCRVELRGYTVRRLHLLLNLETVVLLRSALLRWGGELAKSRERLCLVSGRGRLVAVADAVLARLEELPQSLAGRGVLLVWWGVANADAASRRAEIRRCRSHQALCSTLARFLAHAVASLLQKVWGGWNQCVVITQTTLRAAHFITSAAVKTMERSRRSTLNSRSEGVALLAFFRWDRLTAEARRRRLTKALAEWGEGLSEAERARQDAEMALRRHKASAQRDIAWAEWGPSPRGLGGDGESRGAAVASSLRQAIVEWEDEQEEELRREQRKAARGNDWAVLADTAFQEEQKLIRNLMSGYENGSGGLLQSLGNGPSNRAMLAAPVKKATTASSRSSPPRDSGKGS